MDKKLKWIAFAAVLLAAAEALARAGGGENYVGGGGGGGGGGHGGGGGADISFLIYLLFAYPEVGVPLIIVVAIFSIVKRSTNPDNRTRRAVAALEKTRGGDRSALAAIRARDPGFDEERFLARAKATELAVQAAWCAGDMSKVRHVVSDGLLRRFQTQLAIMRHQGVLNTMADHAVQAARIHAAASGSHFDAVHVHVTAAGRDLQAPATLSSEEAARRARGAKLSTWSEVWSFLRRPGAATKADGGALEGRCPSCGAALPAGEAARCDHCQALVNSGEHDWVLTEITQPEEWRAASTGQVPGLAALQARDPRFNREAAEDRGSYVFWRWIEALVLADPRPLAKCATEGMRQRLSDGLRAGPAALHKVAVGAVDLVGCEAGEEGGRDLCHVKVLWSSARSESAAPHPSAHVFTLGRRAGATGSGGFSFAHCGNCMGPLTENDSQKCDFCGEDLAAGDTDWVLEAVRQPEEVSLRTSAAAGRTPDDVYLGFVPDMANQRERVLLLMRMAAVVVADGRVTKEERKLLANCAKRWSVPLEAVEPILAGQVPAEVANTMKPAEPDSFFAGLVSAALVDGRIDKKEEQLLRDVAKNLGLAKERVTGLMTSMTNAAKAAAAR